MRPLALALLAAALVAAPAHAQKKGKSKAAAPIATADTSKAAESDPWVASKSSKKMEYYKAGCTRANGIKPKNLVHFRTEEDAKKAGYSRSKSAGC